MNRHLTLNPQLRFHFTMNPHPRRPFTLDPSSIGRETEFRWRLHGRRPQSTGEEIRRPGGVA